MLSIAGPAAAVGPRGIDIPIPFDPTGGLSGVSDVCNNLDAPMPASPYGDGSFIVKLTGAGMLQKASTGLNPDTPSTSKSTKPGAVDKATDPFTNKDVSIESQYGTTPQWWTYDNGCTGQFVAGAGTALGNILLEISGILPNWSHALLNSVISPNSFFNALDKPIRSASEAVTNGVWTPWVSVVMLLVAGTVMLRARDGRLARAVTAAGWALGVLVVTSWLIQYPVESTKLVDQGVRSATGLIATGFNDGKPVPAATSKEYKDTEAVRAVDGQMDSVIRNTQYRTWLSGVFGDPDSHTAHIWGARVYRSTHFTWSEYDTYRKDPDGKGKQILQAKQDQFKQLAGDIKKDDPVAYEYFKGGKWGQRVTTALVNCLVVVVTCGFLLIAGLAIVLSFALIRLLVPFAPAAGVLFMLDHTRDAAVSMLKRVVGPLVMGPIYFLVALLLLRFDSAILTANMWFILKLALIGVLSVIAWQLTRPATFGMRVPGVNRLTSMLTSYVGARTGTEAGVRDATEQRTRLSGGGGDVVAEEPSAEAPGNVFLGRAPAPETGALPPPQQRIRAEQVPNPPARAAGPALGSAGDRPVRGELSGGQAQEVSGAWFDSRSGDQFAVPHQTVRGELSSPSSSSARASEVGWNGSAYDRDPIVTGKVVEPNHGPQIDEANVDYDEHGQPVFKIYTSNGVQEIPVNNWGTGQGGAA